MSTLYPKHRPAQISQAFYDELVEWQLVHELLEYFQAVERERALQHLVAALDTAVHHAVLVHLPEELHIEYLDLSEKYHHDQALIVWLESHIPEVKVILKHQLYVTKQELKDIFLTE